MILDAELTIQEALDALMSRAIKVAFVPVILVPGGDPIYIQVAKSKLISELSRLLRAYDSEDAGDWTTTFTIRFSEPDAIYGSLS